MKVRNLMVLIVMALIISISSSAASLPKVIHATKNVVEKHKLTENLNALGKAMFHSLVDHPAKAIEPAIKAVTIAKSLKLEKTTPENRKLLINGLIQCRFSIVQRDRKGFCEAFNPTRKLFESIYKIETGKDCPTHIEGARP